MPWISGCCCFESLSKGSKASGIFTSVVALINLAIGIIILVNLHWMEKNFEPNEQEIFFPPGCFAIVYLAQIFNVVLLIAGLLLIIGINRVRYRVVIKQVIPGKSQIFFWIYFSIFHRAFESFMLVYVCIWYGSHRFNDIIFVAPEIHTIIAYWMICFVLFICAFICVVSFWQEVRDEIDGSETRKKHFLKLSNIRYAGYKRHGGSTPGTGMHTPRSVIGQSRTTILAGQGVSQPSSTYGKV